EAVEFAVLKLEERLRETAFLTRGLRISLVDERGAGHRVEFCYQGGIEGVVEVAIQWNGSYQESIFSFANNINTHEGGSHLSGFRSALTRRINKYARDKAMLREKEENLVGEDVREGLTAVISAKLRDPQFEGQTKTKLGNPGMAGFVESIVNAGLAEFLEENPAEARAAISKSIQAPRAREPPRSPSCSSSRAPPPAAPRSRAATATPRRSCRCAARSSTSKRAGSTRCWPTPRSRR